MFAQLAVDIGEMLVVNPQWTSNEMDRLYLVKWSLSRAKTR